MKRWVPIGLILMTAGREGAGLRRRRHREQATTFVRRLYAGYANDDFSPLKNGGRRYFDPEMVALIRADSQLAKGEVGALDFDQSASARTPAD